MSVESLKCKECGATYELGASYACENCFGPLEVTYDYSGLDAAEIKRRIQAGVGVFLAVILLAVGGYWAFGGFEGLSAVGMFSLLLGVFVAVVVGVGLMALVFYSNQSERDEMVYRLSRDQHDD